MALFHITHFSQTLGKEVDLYVVAPDEQSRPMRVVYQLHGYGDHASSWLRHSGIERHAVARDLMVVLVDGGKGYYSDALCGHFNYESHLLETVAFIDQHFKTLDRRSARGIGGYGMGGYGALKLAFKHEEMFAAVAVHSAEVDLAARHRADVGPIRAIFGTDIPPRDDCLHLVTRCPRRPALYFDCGAQDERAEENRSLHELLKGLAVKHRYAEFPGGHGWDYWDAHLSEALSFQDAHLQR